jgi:hypothetical protein
MLLVVPLLVATNLLSTEATIPRQATPPPPTLILLQVVHLLAKLLH